jgi:membrane-associated protease RseP (regulator of RpoE activity)
MRGWLALLAVLFLQAASPASSPAVHRLPFELVDNRVFITCSIDGVPGFALIFDTGAGGLLLTPEAAARIHARTSASQPITGAGSGSLRTSQTKVNDVTIAGINFGRMTAQVADLGAIRRGIGFSRLDGVLGYDVFDRFAVGIDMDHRLMTLSREPVAASPSARTTAFSIRQNLIEIPASVDGRNGMVVLDLGDRSSLTLFEPFARRNGFYRAKPIVRNALTGFGVGGPIVASVLRTRLDALGYSVPDVLTREPKPGGGGFFAGSKWSASIGTGFLRRFNMIFDFPRKQLVVWPSLQFECNDRYDSIGMWISTGAHGPTIAAVTPGSPAARSGVRPGETIVAVNGDDTEPWSPPRLRTWFATRPDREPIAVRFESANGSSVTRNLTPQDALAVATTHPSC